MGLSHHWNPQGKPTFSLRGLDPSLTKKTSHPNLLSSKGCLFCWWPNHYYKFHIHGKNLVGVGVCLGLANIGGVHTPPIYKGLGYFTPWLEDYYRLANILGPPVERLEQGYPFSVVYFSRGTLPQKRVKWHLAGGPSTGDQVWVFESTSTPIQPFKVPCCDFRSSSPCLISRGIMQLNLRFRRRHARTTRVLRCRLFSTFGSSTAGQPPFWGCEGRPRGNHPFLGPFGGRSKHRGIVQLMKLSNSYPRYSL